MKLTTVVRILLNDTEVGALLALQEEPSVSGRTVALKLDVSPTTAGRALDRLQCAGLVKRQQKGRSYLWRLTPTGSRVLAE